METDSCETNWTNGHLALTCGGEFRLSSLSLKSSLKSKERRQRNCFKWSLKLKSKETSSVAHHKQAPDRVYKRRKKGGREKDIHLILQKRDPLGLASGMCPERPYRLAIHQPTHTTNSCSIVGQSRPVLSVAVIGFRGCLSRAKKTSFSSSWTEI